MACSRRSTVDAHPSSEISGHIRGFYNIGGNIEIPDQHKLEYRMNQEITAPRRQKLAELLEDGDNVILFAKPQPHLEKFSQDSNFLYFTGLNHPELIYIAGKSAGRFNDMLLIERSNPEREVWEGKKLTAEEAREQSGIQRIHYVDEFLSVVGGICQLAKRIYANYGNVALNRPVSYPMFMLEPIRQRFPQIIIEQINTLIHGLRAIKSDWEVMQLQKAIDITGKGIMDILENARAGMMEYELEAMLFYRMQRAGVQRWGFDPIIASGINAATLHYEKNDCMISSGDLVLLDVGASYNNYSADISRTFPINGTFTERQKELYSLVLEVQKTVISMIKPGITIAELHKTSRDLLAEGLVRIGLIETEAEITKYYMHGIGHFLGMDTHDVNPQGHSVVLEQGHVLTVEPGIYIPEEKLGIRIEDDVLVTAEGHCVLSQNIPKEISELEEICQEAQKQ